MAIFFLDEGFEIFGNVLFVRNMEGDVEVTRFSFKIWHFYPLASPVC